MKHNYTLAKTRELQLVEALNSTNKGSKIDLIAEYIKSKLGYQFNYFTHSGDTQSQPGDILGFVKGEKIPIELKILDNSKVTESHGGVSGDFFKIFNPTIQGYKQFEETSGVEKKRWDIVSKVLQVDIRNHKDYVKYEKQVKSNDKLKQTLVNLTNEYKVYYIDYLVQEISQIPPDKLLNVCNSIFKGYRKPQDVVKHNLSSKIIEVQVGNFLSDNITITHKTFNPKKSIESIERNGYALQINFDSGYIKFPVIHGNGYQGSGRTRSFKCMFTL
jgi:hypothetical protein